MLDLSVIAGNNIYLQSKGINYFLVLVINQQVRKEQKAEH
jgi:hypothetical protein